MALIKCKECGKEISDKATTCIHCGCPVILNETKKIDIKTEEKEQVKSNNKLKRNYGYFKGIYEEDIVEIKRKTKISIIPIFVIGFVLSNLLFKNISTTGLIFFTTIPFTSTIVFVYMTVLSIKCCYRASNNIERKQTRKGLLILIVLTLLFTIIVGGGNGDSKNVPTDSELNACRGRSTTYTKCSWSTFENRCVCKLR